MKVLRKALLAYVGKHQTTYLMSKNKPHGDLVIYGAWYFSQVIAEAARACGWSLAGFVDPDPPKGTDTLDSFPANAHAIVAIGSNEIRAYVFGKLIEHRRNIATIVHPVAHVSPSARIGNGCYIAENVTVRTNATVGNGTNLNSGAVVSHDCCVGDFVTFGPNAATAGHVSIGDLTTLGVGASARPNAKVGNRCVVGAGTAVVKDVPDDVTAIGVPARVVPHVSGSQKHSDWKTNTVW